MSATSTSSKAVAIIGGGITGATAAQTLAKCTTNKNLIIHLFDQGRRGVGGRTSSRSSNGSGTYTGTQMKWDHGCQFFRADTPQFKEIINEWMEKDFVREWNGNFISSSSNNNNNNIMNVEKEFFGMSSTPPFYVATDGMQSLPKNILDEVISNDTQSSATKLKVYTGTRVAQLERDEETNKWILYGTDGEAAYHDTPEKIAQANTNQTCILGEQSGYDAIILTDVSSSFGKWHRASAGVPESFAKRVRERVGARVPLFSAMIAFEKQTAIPFDAASFDNDSIVWFAAKSNSKPGMEDVPMECWTIVSTPEYAMKKIEETPMQDAKTGEFIPQSSDYLTAVPGPDLCNAFKSLICQKDGGGILGNDALDIESLPKVIHVDAQRWGSAMPSHRHTDANSPTCKVLSGVSYDSGRYSLAPTKEEKCVGGEDDDESSRRSFLMDEKLMLFQAGDMMGIHTPGLESAALSGKDAAKHLSSFLY